MTVRDSVGKLIARAAGGNPLLRTEMIAVAAEAGDEVVVPSTPKAPLPSRLDLLQAVDDLPVLVVPSGRIPNSD